MDITRSAHLSRVSGLLQRSPVVGILGARQVGKTTLARQLVAERGESVAFLDLENPVDLARLQDPMLGLKDLRGLVVLDEIQRRPEIFTVLRVLADRPGNPARFLVLGSASPDLLRQTSESLAGRIVYYELRGFGLDEVGVAAADALWLRGGFPRSFLAESDRGSFEWRHSFVRTFLERDLPQLGVRVPSEVLRRFWNMLAHYHGQVWNAAELARGLAVAATTVRHYLGTLASALVMHVLPPWYENIGKRQVKAPKVYIADSGLLHALLGIEGRDDLLGHPKVGASWEGFALAEVVARLRARPEECFFWRTQAGAELDLLVVRGPRRLGFEFKRGVAPTLSVSMRSALVDLRLTRLDVIHAGEEGYPLAERARAVPLRRLLEDVEPLG